MAGKKTHITPYKTKQGKKEQVAAMFDNIARRYDFLNHLLSLGIDRSWRRKTIKLLSQNNPEMILDVATGTGDLAFEAAKKIPSCRITGVDISKEMMEVGRKKAIRFGLDERVTFSLGDSEELPFDSGSFDEVMVAFGVRNFENLDAGLGEMYRVLKKGGDVFILEFSKPLIFPFKHLYNFYFKYILPTIGKISSRDPKAYNYLFESVQAFPDYGDFLEHLKKAGFHSNKWLGLSLGICSIYIGRK